MIVFRCTQRLAKRLRVTLADDALPSVGALGDWYANVLSVRASRYVLCLSEHTLLPVILPARKADFPVRFPDHLEAVLQHLRIPRQLIERELRTSSQSVFAKTKNRALLGSLNDFILNASGLIAHGASLFEANLRLTETPSKVIGYGFPGEAAREAIVSRGLG